MATLRILGRTGSKVLVDFSNTTTKTGIIQKLEFHLNLGDAGISGNSTLLKQMTGLVNDWYGTVIGDILQTDGRFQFDDTNYTDQPVATFNLVSGQQDYSIILDDNSAQLLDITRVEAQDSSGTWRLLKPLDQNDIKEGYTEFLENGGDPVYYDWIGTVLNLFPAPNFNATNGAKIWFKREGSYFASTDTTKTPGFASPFHKILWLGAAADYATAKSMDSATRLREEVELARQELREFYSRRNKFEQPTFKPVYRSSR